MTDGNAFRVGPYGSARIGRLDGAFAVFVTHLANKDASLRAFCRSWLALLVRPDGTDPPDPQTSRLFNRVLGDGGLVAFAFETRGEAEAFLANIATPVIHSESVDALLHDNKTS